MSEFFYDFGINLLAAAVFAVIIYLLDKKFRQSLIKIFHWGSPCQFTFSCRLNGNKKNILEGLLAALKERNYKIETIEKGYRTILKATKENLETLQINATADDPFLISIDPVQTTVKTASNRLTEITSILQSAKDFSSSKLEAASFEAVLPYNVGLDVRIPKNMKISDYKIELINGNVKAILSLNNKLGIHSSDFIQLAETYRAII